jgi:hypothetical protein
MLHRNLEAHQLQIWVKSAAAHLSEIGVNRSQPHHSMCERCRFCCRSRRRAGRSRPAKPLRGCWFAEALARELWRRRIGTDAGDAYATHATACRGDLVTNLARRRKFWAIAASVNSSCAPRGTRSGRPTKSARNGRAQSVTGSGALARVDASDWPHSSLPSLQSMAARSGRHRGKTTAYPFASPRA